MLWLALRNKGIQCFPDGDRVERVDDRVLCLGPDGLILASHPFDEVLIFTKNADVAELVQQRLDETARPDLEPGAKIDQTSN